MSFSKYLACYQCELLYILVRKSLTLANPCTVIDHGFFKDFCVPEKGGKNKSTSLL